MSHQVRPTNAIFSVRWISSVKDEHHPNLIFSITAAGEFIRGPAFMGPGDAPHVELRQPWSKPTLKRVSVKRAFTHRIVVRRS